jgi:hypothetical protein
VQLCPDCPAGLAAAQAGNHACCSSLAGVCKAGTETLAVMRARKRASAVAVVRPRPRTKGLPAAATTAIRNLPPRRRAAAAAPSGGRARLATPGPWYLFGPARYRAPVEHVRLPDPRLAVDGHLLACTSRLAYAGAYQLTIWTIVPELAAELHTSYLGHPLDHRTCPPAAPSEEWTP